MSASHKSDVKQCTKCGSIKSVRDFYVDRQSKDGRQTQCKACKDIAVRLSDYRAGRRMSPDLIKQESESPDLNRTHKICSCCEKLVPLTNFYKESRTKDGYQRRCKDCQKKSAQISYADNKPKVLSRSKEKYDPKKRRDRTLMENYGITLEQYELMLELQGGKCEICGSDDPSHNSGRFVVDHCHQTNKVRGLLCGECNFMIGKAADDVGRLKSAIAYIERYGASE